MREASYLAQTPAARQWEKIGIRHHHGIALPLFSLYSADSYGIGEYTDLVPLIDWCSSIGFDIIQLLPLNNCKMNMSPYSAISAFALNPLYLGLASLPHIHDHSLLEEELKALPKFSQAPLVDYVAVGENKERFLKSYYRIVGPQLLDSKPYHEFVQSASSWLKSYCVFKILKKRNDWSKWETWAEEEYYPNETTIDSIALQHQEEFNWHCLLQFLCDQQLSAIKNIAAQKNIFLMGDIPILIDRESADVWLHQDLFNLQYSAGAPPDVFNVNGQNWGCPIYRWEAMAQQCYKWWVDRLQWASRYYQIYRLDHIVGFFRIWAIPNNQLSNAGRFIPQDERLWIDHGQTILLKLLDSCDMLPIGEDLGIVPQTVKKCLSTLGICGTRVMRWERKWEENDEYISPEEYTIEGMTTVSTHDSEILEQWWKNHPIEAQLFASCKGWSYQPLLSREYSREILWDSHHSSTLFHINLLQEYLRLIPGLSWPNPEEERINVPGTVSDKNWTYRLRISLEELVNQKALQHLMEELIK